MKRKILALLAGVSLLAIAAPAQANQTPAFQKAVSTHAVGSTWTETEPDGSVVTVKQVDLAVQQGTVAKKAKVSLLSNQAQMVALSQSSCTWGYMCFWDTPGYLGNFWRYDTSYIVNNGSCYNLTVANNNVSEAVYNNSLYTGAIHNWVNCNSPAGQLPNNGNPAQGVFKTFGSGASDAACTYYTNGLPCDWATSIAVNP